MRLVMILLTCLALSLAACGGGDDEGGGSGRTDKRLTPPQIKQLAAACDKTTKQLTDLPPASFEFDPDDPGPKLQRVGKFLDRTDPKDAIEAELLKEVKALQSQSGDGRLGAYATALTQIVEAETARNEAAIAGDIDEYKARNRASVKAYEALRAQADALKAPACKLASALPDER